MSCEAGGSSSSTEAALQQALDYLAEKGGAGAVDYSIDGQSVQRMGAANAALERAVKLRQLLIAQAGPYLHRNTGRV